jgi:hypothetical protein
MARPHGKVLLGKEGGKQNQHWYDFVKSRRVIKRSLQWDGGCPQSKPGTWWIIAKPVESKGASIA